MPRPAALTLPNSGYAQELHRKTAPRHVAGGRLSCLTGCFARRKLDPVLGRQPRGELARALQLGVELGPEEQSEVRDPEPDEEDDDARERPVRPVVGAQVRDV